MLNYTVGEHLRKSVTQINLFQSSKCRGAFGKCCSNFTRVRTLSHLPVRRQCAHVCADLDRDNVTE